MPKKISTIQKNSSYNPIKNALRVGDIGPFGGQKVFQLQNILSYLSTYGPSRLRDKHFSDPSLLSGSATITADNGFIKLKTGTTADSVANLTTVQNGRYQPGMASEAGAVAFPSQSFEGTTGHLDVGIGDGNNEAFFRLDANGLSCFVIGDGVTEQQASQDDFTIDPLDGSGPSKHVFDPVNNAYIYVVTFTWYGAGKITFTLWVADEESRYPMEEIVCHQFSPTGLQELSDPNLPLIIRLENGSGGEDLECLVGGRRYDVLGRHVTEVRTTGDSNTVNVASGAEEPVISFRKKANFPGSRINSVEASIATITIVSEAQTQIYVIADGTLTGASYGAMDKYNSDETAIEVDKSATAITGGYAVFGPKVASGGQSKTTDVSKDVSVRNFKVSLIDSINMTVVARNDSNNAADVTIAVQFFEEW